MRQSQSLEMKIELAIERGQKTVLAKLLDAAPDDVKVTLDRCPLHFAAQLGRTKIVAFLIAKDVDLHAREFSGATPLHLAAGHAHAGVCRQLLEAGADPCLPDSDANLPLHAAARELDRFKERVAIARALLGAGSPAGPLNRQGQSPLQIAAMMGNRALVEVLVEALERTRTMASDDLELAAEEAETYAFAEIAALLRAKL